MTASQPLLAAYHTTLLVHRRHPSLSIRDEIARLLVPSIVARLHRKWPSADPDAALTAAHDAVMWYLENASTYDDTRGGLVTFVAHVAFRRLQDSWKAERRTRAREVDTGPTMLDEIVVAVETNLVDSTESGRQLKWAMHDLRELARTQLERRFIDAAAQGICRAELARALGLEALSASEFSREVHCIRKRLRARAEYNRTKGPLRSTRPALGQAGTR